MSSTSKISLLAVALATVALACDKGPGTTSLPTTKPSTTTAAATSTPTSAPASSSTPSGASFGAGVKLTDTTTLAAILADPKSFAGKTVRVEGQIVDVCPKRGCWMDLAGAAPGQKVRFKVTDGEMVFPVDAKGKRAVAEGVVAVSELSLEESKEYVAHQQREYGGAAVEVTQPMTIVRIDGLGAVIQN